MKVIFICTGNTCRSQIAAQYLKNIIKKYGFTDIKVNSFGLFAVPETYTEPKAIEALKKLGVPAHRLKAKQLTSKDIQNADFIFAMTEVQCFKISQLTEVKVKSLGSLCCKHDISDPYGGSQADYDQAAADISLAVDKFVKINILKY